LRGAANAETLYVEAAMKKLLILAALALLGAVSPAAAQVRTASIGVSATVAEPLRVEVPAGVKLDYRQGRYLDVTTPEVVPGAAGYLVDVVVTRTASADAATTTASGAVVREPAAPARLRGLDGHYRLDLRAGDLPQGEGVRVTYVVATNL
jgi:hypothetical protein